MKILWVLLISFSILNANIKEAFSEGIKASVKVLEYEKSQALKAIPEGYCVKVNKRLKLSVWEEIKLESLALFLGYEPSLLGLELSDTVTQKILCLLTSPSYDEAVKNLENIKVKYPKINKYKISIDSIPKDGVHRIVPVIGQLTRKESKVLADKHLEVEISTPLETSTEGKILKHKVTSVSVTNLEDKVYSNNKIEIFKSTLPKVYFIKDKGTF